LTSSTLPAGQQAAAIFLLDVLYYKNAFENIDKKMDRTAFIHH
jgi:hypothetical protein